jgi:hypothetical protein
MSVFQYPVASPGPKRRKPFEETCTLVNDSRKKVNANGSGTVTDPSSSCSPVFVPPAVASIHASGASSKR